MKTYHPNQTAPENTLIFIPDISGFTQFVSDTDITHSQHIIEELLEEIIDANEIGLEISEIEGDAILFYKEGQAPTAAEMLAQVQRMYVKFHAHLKKYETHRICQCGACSTAHNLSLKFIAHYGPIAKKQVKSFSKLFGKDVIVAHRLMKNGIKHDEYALFTHPLINACSNWVDIQQVAWAAPESAEESYDFGSISYCHLPLQPLQAHVPEPTIVDHSLNGARVQVNEFEALIEAPIDMVFDIISDLSFRHKWIPGIKDSDKLNGKITKNGSSHRCVISGTDKDPFMYSHDFATGKSHITFSETNPKAKTCSVITLRAVGKGLTRIQIHLFMKKNFIMKLMYNLFFKKKNGQSMAQGFENINAHCSTLLSEGRRHANRIELGEFETDGSLEEQVFEPLVQM